jgi:hypothetical protein
MYQTITANHVALKCNTLKMCVTFFSNKTQHMESRRTMAMRAWSPPRMESTFPSVDRMSMGLYHLAPEDSASSRYFGIFNSLNPCLFISSCLCALSSQHSCAFLLILHASMFEPYFPYHLDIYLHAHCPQHAYIKEGTPVFLLMMMLA